MLRIKKDIFLLINGVENQLEKPTDKVIIYFDGMERVGVKNRSRCFST